ncbi:hypothetical protein [Spectribacter hydrogenoxidans]|uniref:DUF4878 domain-containing protein n=2 Tax=Spectribacter TaxID=3160928 RepID=A0ABU3BZE0_9GAMM|nr:hypothetical protein [Salinisphaera sp. W335]MDT0634682.1 hypothetical protein [Salinisphaera sp. W335]
MIHRGLFALAVLAVSMGAQAEAPSDAELTEAVESQLRASAEQQIEYFRKTDKDALRLARDMGTLADPDTIEVSDLKIQKMAETEEGGYDADAMFNLRMGENRSRMAARVEVTEEKGNWKVLKMRAY